MARNDSEIRKRRAKVALAVQATGNKQEIHKSYVCSAGTVHTLARRRLELHTHIKWVFVVVR